MTMLFYHDISAKNFKIKKFKQKLRYQVVEAEAEVLRVEVKAEAI